MNMCLSVKAYLCDPQLVIYISFRVKACSVDQHLFKYMLPGVVWLIGQQSQVRYGWLMSSYLNTYC